MCTFRPEVHLDHFGTRFASRLPPPLSRLGREADALVVGTGLVVVAWATPAFFAPVYELACNTWALEPTVASCPVCDSVSPDLARMSSFASATARCEGRFGRGLHGRPMLARARSLGAASVSRRSEFSSPQSRLMRAGVP